MKFSWKIFFSTVVITLITFSMGGYTLVSSLFQSTYQREAESTKEENKMLRLSMAAILNSIPPDKEGITQEQITDSCKAMAETMHGGDMKVRIRDEKYRTVYEKNAPRTDTELLGRLDTELTGYMAVSEGEEYYIQTASMLVIDNRKIYLESFRNITSIFNNRMNQYALFERLLIVMVIINGAACFLSALWITRPIKRLSDGAHKIAEGDLSCRVRVKSDDEIGVLARDFNVMADSLCGKIEELKDAARRQEDFIGSFAHELKTPLTSIIGYADMLRLQKLTPELKFMSADYIFREGKRLEALSFKLLELLVMKKQELELQKVSMQSLLKETQVLLYPVLKNDPIAFTIEAEEETLYLDPDLMKTVLINLVDNARKSIDGKGSITVEGRREEGGYGICVSDTGQGIPDEELSRITEAFYMVDKSRAREQGGAGLGLAICMEIIERHNGYMEFESTVGAGTRVHICLRREPVQDEKGD